ncbi:MAG: alpha/beta hydrolase [Acidimicrobiia bacterium]
MVGSLAAGLTPAGADPSPPALQWGPCPPPPEGIPDAGQECATLTVPLDYGLPDGRTIDVTVSRVEAANPALRRGVLIGNPGGPGGPGLDLPRIFSVLFPQAVLDRYDLIGFDPRGVGTSAPVSCGLSAPEMTQALVPLTQPGGFGATVDFMRDVADACASTSGAELPHMTTANTARDLDQLRLALGEARVSYLGYSYGTYLGAVYASLFPDHTDRFVLDSSVSPSWAWRQQFRSWGLGGAIRFPDFADFVVTNEATYGFGGSRDEVSAFYLDLVERLDANPIPLPDGTTLNGPFFRELTFGGLYHDALFPPTAGLWQLADSSAPGAQLQELVSRLGGGASMAATPEDNAGASALAIICGDAPWSRSVDRYRRELGLDRAVFRLFGELGSNIWPCAFWPNGLPEPAVPIASQGPGSILVVQNVRDPATPLPGALLMRSALGGRARMVVADQGGHAVYALTPNACANDRTTDFLVSGTAGDRVCAAEPPLVGAADARSDPARARAADELLRLVR